MNRLRLLTIIVILCVGLLLTTCTPHNLTTGPIPDTPINTITKPPEVSAEPTPSQETTSESESTEVEDLPFTYDDTAILAKTVWGEARGCTQEEQLLVVWTVLQRVEAERWPDTIQEVITQKSQFSGYRESHPIDAGIYTLCYEALVNWSQGAEPPTHETYAPTLPYYFFDGDGKNNWFREEWR